MKYGIQRRRVTSMSHPNDKTLPVIIGMLQRAAWALHLCIAAV